MLKIYHSNKLDVLKNIITSIISTQPLRDPFQSEIIIVQNICMLQWIQIKIAEHLNIMSNIKFPSLVNFISQISKKILPNFYNENNFSKMSMIWILMGILPTIHKKENFEIIYQYLDNDDDKRKCFHFAVQIADLFEQYLLYRPDWLDSWQCDNMIKKLTDTQKWQSYLWQHLIKNKEKIAQQLYDHPNIYTHLINFLENGKVLLSELPERIFICGISSFPPICLQILEKLGNYIDIHLLFNNPCRHYWDNINNSIILDQLKKNEKNDSILFNIQNEQQQNNPLLASWGKVGRDTVHLISQLESIQEIDIFVESTDDCLLKVLQRDILESENHALININDKILSHKNDNRRLIQMNDHSLSLHICHSPLREVEALHDNLLAMMENDLSLTERDIIVMVTDIDIYAPFIQAVFNSVPTNRYLSYNISDRQIQYVYPILSVFLTLLKLPYSRFTTEQVLELLEVPELAARFNIKENELNLLRKWTIEVGIRWGLDDYSCKELETPINYHTWYFGLTRMFLGYAMDSKYGPWENILPYDESSGETAYLIGYLAEFLIKLQYWRNFLKKPRKFKIWLTCIKEMIKDFFILDENGESAFKLLEKQWNTLLQYGIQVNYTEPISIILLHDALSCYLIQERVNKCFLIGSINFCAFMPMRSLPFKVICLLGMNDGAYPRTSSTFNFNLMTQYVRLGDRTQRDDDCYTFLEAILSAQQKFYISFVGYNIQDNTKRHPSVLVNELCEYITKSFFLPGDEDSDIEISSKRMYDHLWQLHSRTPFAQENFIPGKKNQSFAEEWLPAAHNSIKSNNKRIPNLITQSLKKPLITKISIKELYDFYNHPVRTWFQKRLLVSFHKETLQSMMYEPFVVDGLTNYQINKKILNILIKKENIDILYYKIHSLNILPYGAFGKIYWNKQCREMNILAKQIQKWYIPSKYTIETFLNLGSIQLHGLLPKVQSNGLLRWSPSILSIKDGLLLWLEHLIYCAMGGKGDSRMLGRYNSKWHFSPISIEQSKKYLHSLTSGYCQGMIEEPLLLLHRSSEAWITSCFNKYTLDIEWQEDIQQIAYNELIKAWQGNERIYGEKHDPYLRRLIYQLDKIHIEKIIMAAQVYLLPFLKFNSIH